MIYTKETNKGKLHFWNYLPSVDVLCAYSLWRQALAGPLRIWRSYAGGRSMARVDFLWDLPRL